MLTVKDEIDNFYNLTHTLLLNDIDDGESFYHSRVRMLERLPAKEDFYNNTYKNLEQISDRYPVMGFRSGI